MNLPDFMALEYVPRAILFVLSIGFLFCRGIKVKEEDEEI